MYAKINYRDRSIISRFDADVIGNGNDVAQESRILGITKRTQKCYHKKGIATLLPIVLQQAKTGLVWEASSRRL